MFSAPVGQIPFPVTYRPRDFIPDNLRTWSVIQNHALPEREAIRAIHVYDFDNTLFTSPLPNPKLWHGPTLGHLQSPTWLANGGWWHDSRILAATGYGLEEEERRAWEGWWNEHIVQLVQLSMLQKDALTVLLTGRSVKGFAALIERIVKSKGLQFNMIVLKPETMPSGHEPESTISFKRVFLEELLDTYREAQELRIYEDRMKHVRSFEEFCQNYTQTTYNRRAHLNFEVIQVAEVARTLDPIVELSQIQKMVNEHNSAQRTQGRGGYSPLRIKKTVFCSGYLLNAAASASLLNTLEVPSMVAKENDVKLLANNVLISPKPASKSVLSKTGPFGTKVEFEVMGVAHWERRVWAALVKPVEESVKIYTDNPEPIIVLAVRRGTKPVEAQRINPSSWKRPTKAGITFSATVGERLLLRIEEDNHEGEFAALFPKRRSSGNMNVNTTTSSSATPPQATMAIPSWGTAGTHPHFHRQFSMRGHHGTRGGGRGGGGTQGFFGSRGGSWSNAGRSRGPPMRDHGPIGTVADMMWLNDAY